MAEEEKKKQRTTLASLRKEVEEKKREIEELKGALEEEEKKAKEYYSYLQRVQADFENLKKRVEREREEFVRYANEDLIVKLLEVLDNLERAIQIESENVSREGIEKIYKHMLSVLESSGVKQINALGEKFDPFRHEALMTVNSEDDDDETIVEEFQKGYTLHSKVIRPSKVKVVKNQR